MLAYLISMDVCVISLCFCMITTVCTVYILGLYIYVDGFVYYWDFGNADDLSSSLIVECDSHAVWIDFKTTQCNQLNIWF